MKASTSLIQQPLIKLNKTMNQNSLLPFLGEHVELGFAGGESTTGVLLRIHEDTAWLGSENKQGKYWMAHIVSVIPITVQRNPNELTAVLRYYVGNQLGFNDYQCHSQVSVWRTLKELDLKLDE